MKQIKLCIVRFKIYIIVSKSIKVVLNANLTHCNDLSPLNLKSYSITILYILYTMYIIYLYCSDSSDSESPDFFFLLIRHLLGRGVKIAFIDRYVIQRWYSSARHYLDESSRGVRVNSKCRTNSLIFRCSKRFVLSLNTDFLLVQFPVTCRNSVLNAGT